MVRHSTKLIAACIVLGVVNQACAIGTVGKGPTGEVRSGDSSAASSREPAAVTGTDASARSDVLVLGDPLKPGSTDAAPRITRPVADTGATAARLPTSDTAPRPVPTKSLATTSSDPIILAQAAAAPHALLPAGRTVVEPVMQSAPSSGTMPSARPDLPSPPTTSLASLLHAGPKGADMPQSDTSVTVVPPYALPRSPEAATGGMTPVAVPVPTVYTDTPPEAGPGNLWDRIRSGYAIPEVESPLVQRHMTWYLNRPEYLQRMVERGRRYLHFVVEELENRGMPLEIALLPMIESAYNPVAYSRAHASGIWQFIPATGKRYGLEQNWWYDGRRDVTAATGAALDYLQKLHNDFGDWQLALAAYNWGEGAVGRAVEKNRRLHKPTDYSALKMPKETANYLPKLQAVKNIIADPARYGIALDDIPNQPYFIRVHAPSHIDMKRAAQLAEVPLEEFRSLNPAHNRPVITSDGERTLLVPFDKAETFANNLEANDDPLVSWQTYTLKPGEKLDKVAARYGISVNTLRQVNGIGTRKHVRTGQTLLVPTPAAMQNAALEQSFDPLEFQPPTAGPEMEIHRVKRTDSLQRIANHYGVTTRQLIRWNNLKGGRIAVGQQLTIYPDTAPVGKRSAAPRASKHGTAVKHTQAAKVKKAPAAAAPKKKHLARN